MASSLLFSFEGDAAAQATASFPTSSSGSALKPAAAPPPPASEPPAVRKKLPGALPAGAAQPAPVLPPSRPASAPVPTPPVAPDTATASRYPAGPALSLPAAGLGPYNLAPALLPYRAGLPVPPGYKVEHRAANGLIIGGLASLIVGYATAIAVGGGDNFKNGTGWVIVPVLGPWAAIGARAYHCENSAADVLQAQTFANQCVRGAFNEVQTIAILSADAVVQATGAVLFLAGLASGEEQLVRTEVAAVRVTPRAVGRDGFGIGFDGRF